jgi:hypothetical protein
MYNGPYINNTGLVFGYDTGIGTSTNDVATRLYPGDPTTNAIPGANTFGSGWATYGSNDGTFITEFGTTGYQILNRLSWNGIYQNFNLGSAGNYTFSAWFKYLGGAANNNGATVYISNYGGGDTAAGLNKSLVGVWQRVSITVNVTAPGNVYFYLISYGGGGDDRSTWQVTMPQAELGTIRTPFVNGTRSSTQALIDAKRATTIDLSTVSFNSSAQPIFDGTDDYIDLPTSVFPAMNQMTIELINFGIDARNSSIIAGGVSGNQDLNVHLPWSDGNIYWDLGRPFNRIFKAAGSDYIGWHHWVFTKNPSTGIMNIYRDGSLWHTGGGLTSSIISLSGGNASIGRYSIGNFNAYYHNGIVPVMRIYNVELTALQVAQNFQAYRSRFGI